MISGKNIYPDIGDTLVQYAFGYIVACHITASKVTREQHQIYKHEIYGSLGEWILHQNRHWKSEIYCDIKEEKCGDTDCADSHY